MSKVDRRRTERDGRRSPPTDDPKPGTAGVESDDATPTLLDVALANMPHGLCMFDENKRLILCNVAYAHLYDLPDQLIRPGTPLCDILDHRERRGSGPADMSTYFDVVDDAHRTGGLGNRRIPLKDGRTIQVTHNPMRGGGYVAVHEDVTAWAQAEAEARHLATHDVLTGLPNRSLFADRLTDALRCLRPGCQVAIHCFDLYRFKAVNDTYGHPVGDRLLQMVAVRTAAVIGSNDLVARLGGDEFVVLQPDVADWDEAGRMASRLVDEVERPFPLDGRILSVGASVGTALCDGNLPADALLQQADMALSRAKSDGRSVARIYDADMGARMRDRRRLESDLRDAMDAGALELRYQPIVGARTAQIRGFEALLRWSHPERGPVSPSDFIPIAEEAGLITRLTAWVLGKACLTAADWPGDVSVAVNLSSLDVGDGRIVQVVRSALGEAGLAPSRLELEITETALLVEGEATLSSLHELRRLGVRIALDDFGTGFSSLSYLRRFPFDKIKIDRSFVRDMGESPECAAIVQAVAALGRALRMVVTAEGVETARQLVLVRDQGCDEVQGYLYSPAVTPEAVLDMLRLGWRPGIIAA